jgi:hypothetical protein
MKLAVYQYCDESQRQPHELSIRFAWCDRAPAPGELIAMGDEATWQVADCAVYEGAGQITHVYAVSLYRKALPPRADWELYALKANYPEQSLQLQISDVGSEILGYEINFLGQTPTVDSQLIRYGIREETFVTRREAWQVARGENFMPNFNDVPFHHVYLAFYKVAHTLDSVILR